MKKFNKIMTVLMLAVAVFAFVSPVFAEIIDTDIENNGAYVANASIGSANAAVTGIWKTVKLILQVLAIAAIILAGVRYMFASADQKADIKKSMTVLVIGAVLVFGATIVIDFITNIAGDIKDLTV